MSLLATRRRAYSIVRLSRQLENHARKAVSIILEKSQIRFSRDFLSMHVLRARSESLGTKDEILYENEFSNFQKTMQRNIKILT